MPLRFKHARPILVKECKVDGFVLFPDSCCNDMLISTEDRLELHAIYSKIYIKFTKILSNKLEKQLRFDKGIIRDSVLHTLPKLLKVFFDLSFRINKAVNHTDGDLSVVKMPYNLPPDTIENFTDKARVDYNFNAELIHIIGKIFGLSDSVITINYTKKDTHQKTFINNNSRLYKRTVINGVIMRLKKNYHSFFNLFFKPKFGVLDISTLNSVLTIKGLYGKFFKRINFDINIPESECDTLLRSNIFTYEDIDIVEMDIFLDKITLNNRTKILYKKILVNFLRDFYPKHSLEMSYDYVNFVNKYMDNNNFNAILTGAGPNTKTMYFLSLAKKRKITRFRLQHGGYFGYMQYDSIWTNEYTLCDYYFTWGWDGVNKINLETNKFISFVSPWLSERKKFWKKNKIHLFNKNFYDVVIAPTRLEQLSSLEEWNTVDYNFSRSHDLVRIVYELSAENINILYKSPSLNSSASYSKAISKMKKIGGSNFHIMDNIDKGITPELLKKVSIILWEVVGTGFLECITCEIPTMVFVSDYSIFDDNMVKILKNLEKVGVVHTNEKTIASAIQLYKNNTDYWFSDIERKKYIRQFINIFCNTSDNWDDELVAKIGVLGLSDKLMYG